MGSRYSIYRQIVHRRKGIETARVDIPLEELRVAAERAAKDRLSGGCWLAVGDGTALPFRGGWFDAICHSDVMC